MTLSEIKDLDLGESAGTDLIRKWYKQSSIANQFKLIAVMQDPDSSDYIAVDEDSKWSPYSERSKYRFLNFRNGETFPRTITVTDVEGTEMDDPYTYLVSSAVEQQKAVEADPDMADTDAYTDLYKAIEDKDIFSIERWMETAKDKPYFNVRKLDLDKLRSIL